MSLTVLHRSQVRDRTSRGVGVVIVLTVLITMVGAVAPDVPTWMSFGVVVAVVVLLGLPHGAVDHLVEASITGRDPATGLGRVGRMRFHLWYVGVMAGYGVVWLVAPGVALAGFLVVSVHHFGQSDLAYLRLPGSVARVAVQWSRGVFVVGLPLVAHLEVVSPVIASLGGGDPATWSWLADRWAFWCAVIVVQHVVVGAVVARRCTDRTAVRREVVTVGVLGALFLSVDPLVGFAVYFGLWHSLAHLRVLAQLFGGVPGGVFDEEPGDALDEVSGEAASGRARRDPLPVRRMVALVAPRAALSMLGLAGLVGVLSAFGRPDLVLPAVFVSVSVLTVPHLVVVERLWRARRVAATSGVSSAHLGRFSRTRR